MTDSEREILVQLERINDADSSVRMDAIESLTGIKDCRVLFPLIMSLQDENRGIQQASMNALMVFEDEAAIDTLLPLLSDRRTAIVNMAQVILEKIGGSGIELLRSRTGDKDKSVCKRIADILGHIRNPGAVVLLLEMLEDPDLNVKNSAIEGLGRLGDPSAVEPLIELLDEEGWVSLFAVDALGRIGDSRAVRPLTQLLGSPASEKQMMAIDALTCIGCGEAADGLLQALDSVTPESMKMAIKGIVKIRHGNVEEMIEKFGRERLYEYIVEIIRDAEIEPDIRKDFIQAFSVLGISRCSSHIFDLIADEEADNIDILINAADTLERLGDEDTLIEALNDGREICVIIAIRVLGRLKSRKAVPHLISLFEGVDRDIGLEILSALSLTGGRDSLDFLICMLSYGEGHVRGAAVQGLGVMAVPEAVEHLLYHLQQEEYPDVIGKIVGALVEIERRHGSHNLFEDLVSNLSSKKPSVREMVIKGIGLMKWTEAVDSVRGTLNDESWRVRRACLETLHQLNAKDMSEILIKSAGDDKDEVRVLAAQLLGEYAGEKSVNTLIAFLADRNTLVTCKAIEALTKLRAASAIPHLIELIDKGDKLLQRTSIYALGEFAVTEAEETLKAASCRQDPDIRDAALEAYNKLRIANNVIQ